MPIANRRSLVTGGTGLLGSHLVEQLVSRGEQVRVLVRPSSETRFLESLEVELVQGDLTNPQSCAQAIDGCDLVYHAAAKVGDWGAWSEFQTGCLDATETLAKAAIKANVERFVQISSTSAYGHPHRSDRPIEETHPLGVGLWWPWDYYTLSKVESERQLWHLAKVEGLPLTVIRPSWLYGERDRTTTARLIARLKGSGIPVIGPGDNPLSAIYAGNVADAAILAANHPKALGQAYNVTDQGRITQREYLELWSQAVNAPPARWYRRTPHPYPFVFAGAFALEACGKLLRSSEPPLLTRYATWLMARRISYSTKKIRTQLGWRPNCNYQESIKRTVDWFLREQGNAPSSTHSRAPFSAISPEEMADTTRFDVN